MNVSPSLTRLLPSWRKLPKALAICVLISLLAGLIPPPLVRTLLPDPAAELVEAVLPAAAPVEAAPLAQVTGSNVLTITKTVVGTGSGPFNITVTGSNGYNNATTVSPGTPTVLTGLASGIYTVTESSPGAGWTTVYTATPGTGGSTNAVVTLGNSITAATFAATQITGMVYRDYNSDGMITANGTIADTGAPSVTATIYDNLGNSVSTVTSASGRYTVTPSFDGPYRVVFSNLPTGYEPSRVYTGTQNGTSVQLINTAVQASGINLGISRSCDYCQSNPLVVMNRYRYSNDSATNGWLISFPYLSDGRSHIEGPTPATVATLAQVGATWGLAYQRTTRTLYASAFLKRHTQLKDNANDGFGDLGAIYAIPQPGGSPTLWVDLAALGVNLGTIVDNSARNLLTTPQQTDVAAYPLVGKAGLGDIDLSDDETKLYVLSLNDRTLYTLDTNTKGIVASNPVPSPTCGVYQPGVMRIAAGTHSGGFTDSQGKYWSAAVGYYFNGSVTVGANSNTIANTNTGGTSDAALYQQYVEIPAANTLANYQLIVPNGTYSVTLHFSEPTATAAGQRLFSVTLESNAFLTNYDIFTAAGGQNRARIESGVVTVSDGVLNIDLTRGTGNPLLNAIEVVRQGTALPTASSGEFRPFALKYSQGQVYVGGVCDAAYSQNQADLSATVYRFDSATFTPALTFPLTYAYPMHANGDQIYGLRPWTDLVLGEAQAFYTQLALADIEFDSTGAMVMSFFDRHGHQTGDGNLDPLGRPEGQVGPGGELLRAAPLANGAFVLESNGVSGGLSGAGVGNGEGPGGGEFYYDRFPSFNHHEVTVGGMAVMPGSGKVGVASFDPLTDSCCYNQGGVRWYNEKTGVPPTLWGGFSVYTYGPFSKGHGLGDMELLCDPAPLEIGNRVWNDVDGDGVQDAGEPGLSGITVSRQGPTNTVTTVTDANGLYYFGNLQTNTAYTLTITPPSGYSVTSANAAALSGAGVTSNHAISDTIDSDAALVSGKATIYYTTGSAGQNNHGLDFGFTQPAYGQVAILNTYAAPPSGTIQLVKNTVGGNGTFPFSSTDPDLDVVSLTTVGNVGSSTVITKSPGSYLVSEDALPANWALTHLVCSGDTDNGSSVTLASRQVQIDLDANEQLVCTFTNTYTPPPPSYTVRKTRLTPDPVRIGDDITYTIAITNTGGVTITTLPLRDSYDRLDILFSWANVLPDDSTNDGQLDWSDLTASLGRDLGLGQSFVVTTVFVARSDTTLLPSGASVNTARVLITPTQTVTAPVRIEAPTAVETTNRQAIYAAGQVTLTWQTANEVTASGFNILRYTLTPAGLAAASDQAGWVKLNEQPIPAQQPGQANGAVYTYTDNTISIGYPYRYVLEIVDNSGVSAYRELGTVRTGSLLFLPQVGR